MPVRASKKRIEMMEMSLPFAKYPNAALQNVLDMMLAHMSQKKFATRNFFLNQFFLLELS